MVTTLCVQTYVEAETIQANDVVSVKPASPVGVHDDQLDRQLKICRGA